MIAAIDDHMKRAVLEALPFYRKHSLEMYYLLAHDRPHGYPEGKAMLLYEDCGWSVTPSPALASLRRTLG